MQHLEDNSSKVTNVSKHSDKVRPWLEKKLRAKQKNRLPLKSFLIVLGLCLFGSLTLVQTQIHRFKKKERALRHSVDKLKYQAISANCLGQMPVPKKLANIPFGEDSGLILGTKTINIRSIHAPHNPSLIKSASGYDLFFRYDIVSSKAKFIPYYSHIGVVSLNQQFEQGEKEFKKIPLESNYVEDPRVVTVGDQLYLTFNVLDEDNPRCRFMGLANLDPKTFDVNYTTLLDMNLKPVEKNWGTFEFINGENKPELIFEYQISPRTLFSLPNPQQNVLRPLLVPKTIAYCNFPWPSKWGEIRGGTPAQKIGDEYLAFFHSSFTEKNGETCWYVMGAYTFKAEFPFSITGMSPYPILFRGIFDTPTQNTAQNYKRVVFPSGFVIEKQGDRELVHLACGENDCAVKIVTFDKEVLLKSMHRFDNN